MNNSEPGAKREVMFVIGTTVTSPCNPCARPMRPTSSRNRALLRDVDRDAHAFGGTRGAGELADRLDDATALADDATEITGTRVNQQGNGVAPIIRVDEHTVRVVDEMPGDVLHRVT